MTFAREVQVALPCCLSDLGISECMTLLPQASRHTGSGLEKLDFDQTLGFALESGKPASGTSVRASSD